MASDMASISNSTGEFIFSLSNDTAMVSHSRTSGASIQEVPLMNAKPRTQISGGKLEQREIAGECTELSLDEKLDALFSLKDSDKPVSLVLAGKPLGLWTIGQVREQNSETVPNGLSRKVKFSVELKEFANA